MPSIFIFGSLIDGTQSNPSSGGTITLSGDGVNNSTQYFIPSAAGMGDHIIYRTIKAPNQCVATAQRKITVNNTASDYIIGLNDKYCIYNSPVTLTSAFPNAVFSGPGIVSNDPSQILLEAYVTSYAALHIVLQHPYHSQILS